MNSKNLVLVAVVVILLVASAFLIGKQKVTAPASPDAATTTAQAPSSTSPLSTHFTWQFAPGPIDDDGIPSTKVTLVTDNETYALGTREGSCADIRNTRWTPRPDTLSGAICYFAGSGTEFSVASRDGKLFLDESPVDESQVSSTSFRGAVSGSFEIR